MTDRCPKCGRSIPARHSGMGGSLPHDTEEYCVQTGGTWCRAAEVKDEEMMSDERVSFLVEYADAHRGAFIAMESKELRAMAQEIARLRAENARLLDENARLREAGAVTSTVITMGDMQPVKAALRLEDDLAAAAKEAASLRADLERSQLEHRYAMRVMGGMKEEIWNLRAARLRPETVNFIRYEMFLQWNLPEDADEEVDAVIADLDRCYPPEEE